MSMAKKILMTGLAGLLASPGAAYANLCEAAYNKANRTFSEASQAASRRDYQKAAQLFEEAERDFKKVSHARNCKYLESSAKSNADVSRSNASIMRSNATGERSVKTERSSVEMFNQGVAEFNRGSTAARHQQWDVASEAYGRAIRIMKKASPSDPALSRQADLVIQQAREGLELARQMKGQ